MSPLAHSLLCASRYSHLRSLAPHLGVIAATRQVWHLIDAESRRYLLGLWRSQVPDEIGRYIDRVGGGIVPVSAREAREELAAWRELWDWCEGQP